jgi:hypothetical protein
MGGLNLKEVIPPRAIEPNCACRNLDSYKSPFDTYKHEYPLPRQIERLPSGFRCNRWLAPPRHVGHSTVGGTYGLIAAECC